MKILDSLFSYGQNNRIQFLVIGGHAVNAHGERRQTGDLDLLVRDQDRDLWEKALVSLGYQVFHRHRVFLQFKAPAIEQWPVDIMFVDNRTFEGLLAEAKQVNFGGEYDVLVPSIEHLIALKLNALRQVGKMREFKDLADIMALVKRGQIDPREDKFRQLVEKYGNTYLYEKIVKAYQD